LLIQTIPVKSPSEIARIVRSLTAREVLKRVPSMRKKLWGGEFWSDGFCICTVGATAIKTRLDGMWQTKAVRKSKPG
jgi:REP element-mobilizing transposase RayT